MRYFPEVSVAVTLGCGVMAGLLFAFSNFVMRALQRLPPEHGMSAMQHVNVLIVNPVFLLVFLGTGVLSVALLMLVWAGAPVPWPTVAGAICYLAGVIGVTAAFNIPLNNVLATFTATDAPGRWPQYVASWLAWNHVRTVCAVVATVLYAAGLIAYERNMK